MSQENVEIVRSALEAVQRHDQREAASLFDRNAEWRNTPLFPGPAVYRGPEGIIDFWRMLSEDFEQAGMEIEHSADREDCVVVGMHSWGRGSASGVPIDVRWGANVTLHDQRIVRVEVHGSYAKALEAVGLSESTMSQENVEIVRRIYESINRGFLSLIDLPDDVAGKLLEAAFDPAVELQQLSGLIGSGTYRGYDGLRQCGLDLADAFAEVRFVPDRYFEAGDTIVFAVRTYGTGRASGLPTELEIAHLWTLKGGRVLRWIVYPSVEDALEAAGLLE